MSWTGQNTDCPCVWAAAFGGADCEAQTPGVNKTTAVLCLSDLDSFTKVAADVANPDTTNVISDITIATGKRAWTMTNTKNTVEASSGETVNDNGGVDRAESLAGKGPVTTNELNFVKQYLNYDVIVFYEDNDGRMWAMGHEGGLSMTDWTALWGAKSGDEKSLSYTFQNTTTTAVVEVIPATGTNEDFFTKLITLGV